MVRVRYGLDTYEGYAASKTDTDIFIYDENWTIIYQIFGIVGDEWNYVTIEEGDWTELGSIPDVSDSLRQRIYELEQELASVRESMQSQIDTLENALSNSGSEMQERIDILEANLASAREMLISTGSEKLVGIVSGQSILTGYLSPQNGSNEIYPKLTGYLTVPSHYGTDYEGSYEIVPSTNFQLIGTMQKFLEDDILVHPIPYYEVSNDKGGYTVTIGG